MIEYIPYDGYADIEALDEQVNLKNISRKHHPRDNNIVLYNYTQRVMFENLWNRETMQARGLVVHHENQKILARPFPKFFNHDQINDLPWNLSFEITTKLDGSMFFLRKMHDDFILTGTRGSFNSPQALMGNEILNNNYSKVAWNKDYTYIFELIHPENRIIVDYGDKKDIILLAILETSTGKDISLDNAPQNINVVKKYNQSIFQDIKQLADLNIKNEEGFVISFSNGLRVKVKFNEYKKLHALISNTSSKTIWRALSEKSDIKSLYEKLPDEFMNFVNDWISELQNKYNYLEYRGKEVFALAGDGPRNIQAKNIISATDNRTVQSIAFAMLSNKTYEDIIWKSLEPEHVIPKIDI